MDFPDDGTVEISHPASSLQEPFGPTALQEMVFGSVAGMAAEFFEYPFDLAKVRLQSQVLEQSARFAGPWNCLARTWMDEGFRGLYRGLTVPLVGGMAETAVMFLAYREFQNLIYFTRDKPSFERLSIPELGLAAGGAGLVNSFLLTPVELVKSIMQVQMLSTPNYRRHSHSKAHTLRTHILSSSLPASSVVQALPGGPLSFSSLNPLNHGPTKALPGPFQVLSKIVRTTGVRGLWLGHTGTIIRETGGTAAWFAIKETIAVALLARRSLSQEALPRKQDKGELRAWESALSGALSGGACTFMFYPVDTIKSSIQTADELRPPLKTTASVATSHAFWSTARALHRTAGWGGFYAGCGMTMLKSLPTSAILFVVYDGLTQRFAR